MPLGVVMGRPTRLTSARPPAVPSPRGTRFPPAAWTQRHRRSPASSRPSPTSERFRAFVDDFPANARVSEPALPLVLATLHATLDRPLICLLAEDEEARDTAEAVGWYADPARVALLPSRGVGPGSGLEPPRTSSVSAPAHSTCSSEEVSSASRRARSPRACPPKKHDPEVIRAHPCGRRRSRRTRRGAGHSRATNASSASRSAGRSPCEAVSSTSSRARAASRCASSSSETTSSRSERSRLSRSERCTRSTRPSIFPARERAAWRARARCRGRRNRPRPTPGPRARPRLAGRRRHRACGRRRALDPPSIEGAARLDSLPRSQPHVFEAQRPAIAARGLAEAENELAAMVRQGRRVVVTFPHQGEALRTQRLLRKVEATVR